MLFSSIFHSQQKNLTVAVSIFKPQSIKITFHAIAVATRKNVKLNRKKKVLIYINSKSERWPSG